jgi:bifunctional non-homologous end joining protein LigD
LPAARIAARAALAHINAGKIKLYSRGGLNWTHRLRRIAQEFASRPVNGAILDGEIVSVTSTGMSDFSEFMADLSSGRQDLVLN